MKYLNVAEKNDAAKNIAGLLSNGTSTRVQNFSEFLFDFSLYFLLFPFNY